MANLYLVDKPFGGHGLNLAIKDKAAKVVLIQDGVYLDISALHAAGAEIYRRDVERRGLGERLPKFVTVMDYAQLIDLIVANKVVNFA